MYATDFIYDGVNLSTKGFIICEFDGSGDLEEIQTGVPLTFNRVSRRFGNIHSLVSTVYDDALEISFDICKDPCTYQDSDMIITDSELLDMSRWLLRNSFKNLKFIDDTQSDSRYYHGSFNMSKILIADTLYGLRLTFITDRPYALSDTVTKTHTFTANSTWSFDDDSFLVGTTFPNMTITLGSSGDLTLTNTFTGSIMVIKNCSQGEVITIDGDNLIISSSVSSHKLWNDFNFDFLKIGNSFTSKTNTIRANLACTVEFNYKPIIRDAP